MNKPTRWGITLLMSFAAAACLWYAWQAASHRHSLVKVTDERGAVYWTCTMHPQVKLDHPGNCPVCGMPLVKHQAPRQSPTGTLDLNPQLVTQHTPPAFVSIDPRMAQNLGMRTALARVATRSAQIHAVGTVAIDENRIVVVEARTAGWIERLEVRAVGDRVHAGQILASLTAPELRAAQAELALAERLKDLPLIAAARARLTLLGGHAATAPQSTSAIRAPQTGVIIDLGVRPGAQVTPGMPLMKLADLSSVWLVIEVSESEAGSLTAGTVAEAQFNNVPGKTFSGTVEYVYPQLDAATRTVRARVAFSNADGALKPGMYAEVTLLTQGARAATLVPSEAVIRTGTRNVVILAEGEGRYRPVEVTLGAEIGEDTSVLAGIAAGQAIVVSGQFLIDSEASLLGAYQRMETPR